MDLKHIFLLIVLIILIGYLIYHFAVRSKKTFNVPEEEEGFNDYPWCLEGKEGSYGKLWRVDDSNFRILEKGKLGNIISGHKHILIESNLVKTFEKLGDQLEIQQVQIVDEVTGEKWRNYYELIIKNELTTDNIDNLETSGIRIWHYARKNIFVSREFKEMLQKRHEDKFDFSLGFSQFGMKS